MRTTQQCFEGPRPAEPSQASIDRIYLRTTFLVHADRRERTMMAERGCSRDEAARLVYEQMMQEGGG